MERTRRYMLRETKVRVEKNKNKQSSMKDNSPYDIEYEFIAYTMYLDKCVPQSYQCFFPGKFPHVVWP